MDPQSSTLERLRIDRGVRPRRVERPWFWPLLVAVVLMASAVAWWVARPKALVVQTFVVRQAAAGGQKTLLNASGYVTARRAATVSSKVTGKVVEVLVEEGMKVEEGQVLARLDATNVEASLRLAKASYRAAQSALEEIQPNLEFARRELKRFTALAGNKVVSESDLRRAEMEALALNGRSIRQKADIDVRESEIAQWKQQLDDTIIRAPFSGVVISKNAQPGEMISPMSVGGFTRTGICTIVDMGSLEIEVDVNESYLHRVQPAQPVEAMLDAYADWRIPAKVIAIIPTADRQKATVKVRVAFAQLDSRILPDMGVKVAFQTAGEAAEAARSPIMIPRAAMTQADGRDVVWVVRGGKVERRAVSAGSTNTEEVAITAGLQDGEHLVLNAPRELADGARVTEQTR